MKLKTYGSVNQGKLTIYKRNEFIATLIRWKDCEIELTIQSKTKGRSTPQNAYYWGCVLPIVSEALKEHHGLFLNSEEVHDFLKTKFNSIEIVNQDGVIERVPKTTTVLSTADFEEYLENVRRWANDFFGVNIPLPNEQTELNF